MNSIKNLAKFALWEQEKPAADSHMYGPFVMEPYSENDDLFIETFGGFSSRLHVNYRTGFMQFHPMPNEELISNYYNGTFTRSDKPPTPESEFKPWLVDAARDIRTYLQEIAGLPEHFAVHDIGCGFGAFVWAWQQIGCDASGNEANQDWVDRANPHVGNKLYYGHLDKAMDKVGHKIDLFFMSHVLEHLPDPLQTLQTIADSMSEKGILYVTVPNNQCYRVLQRGRRTGQDYLNGSQTANFPMHLNFFTFKSMAEMMRAVGLEPIEAESRVYDEIPGLKPEEIGWQKDMKTNLLGGELFMMACKKGNARARKQPNLDEKIEAASAYFANARLQQAIDNLKRLGVKS